jgi:hypothetical protein
MAHACLPQKLSGEQEVRGLAGGLMLHFGNLAVIQEAVGGVRHVLQSPLDLRACVERFMAVA